VALSYLAGDRATHVFVLAEAGLSHFRVPIGRAALDDRVGRLARLAGRGDTSEAELQSLARELYTALVGPAEAQMAGARHVLVVPDGPLHRLPFAALVRPDAGETSNAPYLVRWRPVFQAPSLSTYARLRRERGLKGTPAVLLAAGDPQYAGAPAAADRLPELPGSRREVETVGEVYGRQAELLLRDEATEARIRARIGTADIVHLAVHGLTNETFPLDSALALTPSPGAAAADNGLLQGWEVIEQLQLRASLVVLSACETAGGGEGGAEGLLGLTRAFQLAGAPAVVASLWRVPDAATPPLMREFHRHVRAGRAPDEALADAQRAMLRDRATAHPYNWAAFILSGSGQ
jgi:CHAT domain-containing protein